MSNRRDRRAEPRQPHSLSALPALLRPILRRRAALRPVIRRPLLRRLRRHLPAALLALLLLAACGGHEPFVLHDLPPAGAVTRVWIGTTRGPDGAGDFAAGRAGLRYLLTEVVAPPDRLPGTRPQAAGARLDPARQFYFHSRQDFATARAFRSAFAAELRRRPPEARETIVFVHGFNTGFAEGVLRLTQMTGDFAFHGVAVHYSWPSADNPFAYEYDRDSVLIARDGLESLLRELHAAGARRVMLVAHSMGALLSMEALRQAEIRAPGDAARLVQAVVLLSPDIDLELFRAQAAAMRALPQPFVIFVSRRDRALTLSSLLTGRLPRLGNIGTASQLSDLRVTLIDVTHYAQGMGHLTPVSSPALIALLRHAGELDRAFRPELPSGVGLLGGVLLSVQSATLLVLGPLTGAR